MDSTESTSTKTVDSNTSEGFTVPDSSPANPKPTLTHTMEKNVTHNETENSSHHELQKEKSVETPKKSKPQEQPKKRTVESPKKTAQKGGKPAETKPKPKASRTVSSPAISTSQGPCVNVSNEEKDRRQSEASYFSARNTSSCNNFYSQRIYAQWSEIPQCSYYSDTSQLRRPHNCSRTIHITNTP